jgi:3-(3-hydroxy-phenyl)propionate hydroxylase
LAQHHAFARKLVNSGRLSVPTHHVDSPLNMPLDHAVQGWMRPGAPMDDAPVVHRGQPGWLLQHLGGRFQLLLFVNGEMPAAALAALESLKQQGAMVTEPCALPSSRSTEAAAQMQLVVLSQAPLDAHLEADWRRRFGAVVLHDTKGLAAQRCDAQPGTALLLRPDQHICARWRGLEAGAIEQALRRALQHAPHGPLGD